MPHDELLAFARGLAADVATIEPVAVWQGAGIDPAEIEKSRQAVVARGRTQL